MGNAQPPAAAPSRRSVKRGASFTARVFGERDLTATNAEMERAVKALGEAFLGTVALGLDDEGSGGGNVTSLPTYKMHPVRGRLSRTLIVREPEGGDAVVTTVNAETQEETNRWSGKQVKKIHLDSDSMILTLTLSAGTGLAPMKFLPLVHPDNIGVWPLTNMVEALKRIGCIDISSKT